MSNIQTSNFKKKPQTFIYTYAFIYDEDKIRNIIKECEEENSETIFNKFLKKNINCIISEKITIKDRIYVFLEKFFNEKVLKLDILKKYNIVPNSKFKITNLKKIFEFTLEKADIYIFPNNIGLLTFEINVDYELEDLYEFNSLFVKVYAKAGDDLYVIRDNKFSNKSTEDLDFINKNKIVCDENGNFICNAKDIKKYFSILNPYIDIEEKEKKFRNELKKINGIFKKEDKKEVFIDKYLRPTVKEFLIFILENKITLDDINYKVEEFVKNDLGDILTNFINNEIDENVNNEKKYKKFIFNNIKPRLEGLIQEIVKDKRYKYPYGRIGLLENEIELINDESSDYLFYTNFKRINEKLTNKLTAIHFDTFITSFYIDFVKINKKIEYYDNFNPLGVNYLFVYTTFIEEFLKEEYKTNFSKYEPFLHNRKKRGEIIRADFYSIYQTQADWFIIGNSQNIVNILTKNVFDNVNSIIRNERFLIYLLVTFQKVYLTILENKFIFTNSKKIVKKILFIDNSVLEFIRYLNNYNFIDVADEPSINNYYKFLRKNSNIDGKIRTIGILSDLSSDIKKIFQYTMSNKWLAVLIIFFVSPFFTVIFKDIMTLIDRCLNSLFHQIFIIIHSCSYFECIVTLALIVLFILLLLFKPKIIKAPLFVMIKKANNLLRWSKKLM